MAARKLSPKRVLPAVRSEKLADLLGAVTEYQDACAAFHREVTNKNAERMQAAREAFSVAQMHWFEHCGFDQTAFGRSIAFDVTEATPTPAVDNLSLPNSLTVNELLADLWEVWNAFIKVRGGMPAPRSLTKAKEMGLLP